MIARIEKMIYEATSLFEISIAFADGSYAMAVNAPERLSEPL